MSGTNIEHDTWEWKYNGYSRSITRILDKGTMYSTWTYHYGDGKATKLYPKTMILTASLLLFVRYVRAPNYEEIYEDVKINAERSLVRRYENSNIAFEKMKNELSKPDPDIYYLRRKVEKIKKVTR